MPRSSVLPVLNCWRLSTSSTRRVCATVCDSSISILAHRLQRSVVSRQLFARLLSSISSCIRWAIMWISSIVAVAWVLTTTVPVHRPARAPSTIAFRSTSTTVSILSSMQPTRTICLILISSQKVGAHWLPIIPCSSSTCWKRLHFQRCQRSLSPMRIPTSW